MNEHDRKNLSFLLTATPEVIRDWAGKMDADDIDYAQELLLAYAEELREKSREILVEAELARMGSNYPDANQVIQRVVDKR